jgi:hypothetical protein
MGSSAKREFGSNEWKQYCIDKQVKQYGVTKDYELDLHFHMRAMHMMIQENTDFQYI